MKVDFLAFGAHPDDVELGCGGTLAKLISEGKTAAIIDLSQGELGTRGTAETRKNEAKNASEILGISFRENLKISDGFIENSEENQMKIVKMIRKYQPDYIFANATEDRHPDHSKAAKLVSDANFLAGLVKIETEIGGEKQARWRAKNVFHYIQWKPLAPDFVIDISEFIEKKRAACLAYKTQFYDPNSTEPETLIATKNFTDSIANRAEELGRLSGVDFAEGFTAEKLVALKNFDGFLGSL